MNITTLHQRLGRLEAANASVPMPSKPDPLLSVFRVLIAHHLGGAGPSESIVEAMARGLGYEKGPDLAVALRSSSGTTVFDDLNIRWRSATSRLLDLIEVALDCDGPTFGGAVEAVQRDAGASSTTSDAGELRLGFRGGVTAVVV